jgi:pimeloyl-ACP methyl ester carboxylesterase
MAFAVVALLVSRAVPVPPPQSALIGSMGSGPTVVLVHGLGSNAGHWLPVARALARDHRVALVELPGHGIAPMMFPFALEQATLALDRALAEQGDEPVVLVGHSVGGLVAAAEAARSPERVRALVLVETALAPQFSEAERDTLLAQLERDWEGTLRAVYTSFGRDSLQGEQLWAEASRVERDRMRAWIPVALSADLSADVSALPMRVLAVLAPHSWPIEETRRQVSAALGYAKVPQLTLERVEECGHFIMLDQPTRLASVIREFATQPEHVAAAD